MTDQQPEDGTPDLDTDSNDDSGTADTTEELETSAPGEVGDDKLPPDLQPTSDNPLARHPDQSGEEDDQIGADREGEAETAPLSGDDADYGGAGSGSDDAAG